MPEVKDKPTVRTFLDDPDRKRRYETALAEIEPELEQIETELEDCQRLSEDDFEVRINARD